MASGAPPAIEPLNSEQLGWPAEGLCKIGLSPSCCEGGDGAHGVLKLPEDLCRRVGRRWGKTFSSVV